MQASQVAEALEVSQPRGKSARNLRAVFVMILACASALIAVAHMSPARADTYAKPTLYEILSGSSCTGVLFEPLPSSSATAEACLNDYYPRTAWLGCDWKWYESGSQTWPSGSINATLHIKSYLPGYTTCATATWSSLAYATIPQACPYGGTDLPAFFGPRCLWRWLGWGRLLVAVA